MRSKPSNPPPAARPGSHQPAVAIDRWPDDFRDAFGEMPLGFERPRQRQPGRHGEEPGRGEAPTRSEP